MAEESAAAASKKGASVQDYLSARINSSLKPKSEKLAAIWATDESKVIVDEFISSKEPAALFVMINAKEDLVVSKTAPKISEVKRKSLFFCKGSDPLDESNVRSTCQSGDFTGNPLEHLLSITQEVYFPLVTTVENQDGWPEVISKEVTENMHKFLASLYITMGSTKGRTLLPMPPANGAHEHEIETLAHDKEQVHVLENAVVTWTKQIKNVLKMDSEALLKSGKHPGPRVELDFWKGKSENLNAIHEQLSSDKIKKVMKVLELTKSTYFPAFNRLCKEVAQALSLIHI